MNVIQISGFHKTGKTTTAIELIKRLKFGGNRVASVKEVHHREFELDEPNRNSYMHKKAGADLVVIKAAAETDFLYYQPMELLNIIRKITADWLIVEGFADFPLPKIVCGKTEGDIDKFLDKRTIAICGMIAKTKNEYAGLPVLDPLQPDQADELTKLVTEKTFSLLPFVDDDCCRLCGMTCAEMVDAIVQGEKAVEDCLINRSDVQLKIDGREIKIVPFVQRLLKNNVLALVSELDGYEKGMPIEIKIERG